MTWLREWAGALTALAVLVATVAGGMRYFATAAEVAEVRASVKELLGSLERATLERERRDLERERSRIKIDLRGRKPTAPERERLEDIERELTSINQRLRVK